MSRADCRRGAEQGQGAAALRVRALQQGERSLLTGGQGSSAGRQPELAGGARKGHGHGRTPGGDWQQIPSVNADLPC